MADRIRKTNRFDYRGINLGVPDSLTPGQSPLGINVIAANDNQVATRSGYTQDSSAGGFTTGASVLTDIGSYTTLGTDNKPRIIVHDSSGGIWLGRYFNGVGVQKGTVGTGGTGASLIPYRPNRSPQSWMYCANATGYKKLSAPDASDTTVFQNVGIAEPQSPPEACVDGLSFNDFTALAANWTPGSTAGATSDVTRSTDTAVRIFQDSASVSPVTRTRYTVQVGTTIQYQVGETVTMNKSTGGSFLTVIEDVYPPINGGTALTIKSIIYLFGPAGHCIIVPSQMPVGDSTATPTLAPALADLRRGSLIQLGSGGGAEVVVVTAVTTGPKHQIAFECVSQFTHAAAENIVGIPGIAVAGIDSTVVGQTITAAQINSAITTGIGTLTQTLGTNPFNLSLGSIGTPQGDDEIHFSASITNLSNLIELKILFDVGDGSFTQNVLYFAVSVNLLQAAATNTQTLLSAVQQLGQQAVVEQLIAQGILPPNANTSTFQRVVALNSLSKSGSMLVTVTGGTGQYTEVRFKISDLIRIGNDQTKTLANCNAVQILVNCSGPLTIGFGSVWVGGGGQPDVGTAGTPYLYRARPRSALTGATGNPSPASQYGVLPRVQPVIVSLPSAAYDSQIDTWDIFRYGGSVTSWRRVGTAASTATKFTDNTLDSAAEVGELLEEDNFQPWPDVDVPYIATVGDGNVTAISVYGTAITVLATTFPASIARWLPGTLLTLDGQLTYTLWNRPIAISGGYLFRIVENASAPTVTTLAVNEPNIAAEPLPYVWGPDSNGVLFAVGSKLRPGALFSSKQFNPDATPNNVYDLTPTSEPLMGGTIIDQLSLVASSSRWWQVQRAFESPRRWNPVEIPAGRGLAAPYGVCTNGSVVYFWAHDSIRMMVPGSPSISLTDYDLWNIFPHDGVPGRDVIYAGFTIYAPDYSRCANFRLSIVNNFLRAHYRDSNGFARTIRYDLTLTAGDKPRDAWSIDQYAHNIVASYQPAQPPGTLLTSGTRYSQGFLADSAGNVFAEADNHNDLDTPISCVYATPEWDAGDARVTKRWMDAMLDSIPNASGGIVVNPISKAVSAGTPSTIAHSTTRALKVVPLGSMVAPFLGLLLQWTDDFTVQSEPTTLIEWSIESVPQPVMIRSWQSVPTSHGLKSYHHIRKLVFAYMTEGANDVELSWTVSDGTAPEPITLPATNGAYAKVEFVPTFNKALLYTYFGTSDGEWAPILEDCEVHVGQWGRTWAYNVFTDLGGRES